MKSVKRVACIVMVALLFCAVFAMSAMAAGASINVTKEVAIVGGETQVTVTVSIPAGVEITGASVRLKYDTDKLSVVSSAAGTLQTLTLNTDIAGTVNGNFFSAVSTNAGGVLYTVTFKVADGETVNSSDIAVSGYYFTSIDENDLEYDIPSADITLHEYEATVTTKPTCTEPGVMTQTCKHCGDSYTEVIPATGHSHGTDWKTDAEFHWHECSCGDIADKAEHTWNDGEVTTEPTVDAEGVKTFTCTVCGATKTEAVDKLEPNYLLGDVDGNGSVGVNDAVQILKYDAFMDVQSEYEASIWERLGDVNGQGGLNYLDAIDILQWDAFLEFDYPIGEPVEF